MTMLRDLELAYIAALEKYMQAQEDLAEQNKRHEVEFRSALSAVDGAKISADGAKSALQQWIRLEAEEEVTP